MPKILNPLYVVKNKVEASVIENSPLSNKAMFLCNILTVDGKNVPVYVDFENRVCLPVRKEI